MDVTAVRAIVERDLESLSHKLGLGHWKIVVRYRSESVNTEGDYQSGGCHRLVDYNAAAITLNPEAVDDEAEVLSVLRHELFHCLLAPYDLYHQAAREALRDDRTAFAVLERLFDHVQEQGVINLQRMYLGLNNPQGAASHARPTETRPGPGPDTRPGPGPEGEPEPATAGVRRARA
jgi:hypothetical protein